MEVENNYEYAHAMFAECVSRAPNNLQFVESLLKNIQKMNAAGVSTWSRWLSLGSTYKLRKLVAAQEWKKVLFLGTELLRKNPRNVAILRAMAEACSHFHYNEVELAYLKRALDIAPKNTDVNRHCARSLGRMGQFDQAIACWHRVEAIKQKDSEASRMISLLCEERLKYPHGMPTGAERHIENAKVMAGEIEDSSTQLEAAVVLDPIHILRQAIAHNPSDIVNYLRLTELCLEADRLNDADDILRRGIAACRENTELIRMLDAVRLRQAQQKLEAQEVGTRRQHHDPFVMPWLEVGLVLAVVALIAQLSPTTSEKFLQLLDFTKWSRTIWFLVNVLIVCVLIAVRYMPNFFSNNRESKS